MAIAFVLFKMYQAAADALPDLGGFSLTGKLFSFMELLQLCHNRRILLIIKACTKIVNKNTGVDLRNQVTRLQADQVIRNNTIIQEHAK